VLFALAVFGVYTVVINTAEWLEILRFDQLRHLDVRHLAIPIALAGAGLAAVIAVPIGSRPGDDGWLWRIARAFPHELPLVALVPVGCAALYLLWRSTYGHILVPLFALFLAAAAANATVYQVYFEPPALLFSVLAVRAARDRHERRSWGDLMVRYGGPVVVIVASLAYLGTGRGKIS
jgi:hypothetical protein